MELNWVDGFEINVRIENGAAVISANREGLLSLANHLKSLAEDPPGSHIHLDALCREEGEAMIRTVETKEKLEKPPLLYDLTSLQRDANRILGFTAQQTLDFTQSLYEKKLVTYPRTDSRYLTDDMREMLPALIASVAEKFGYSGDALRTDPVRPASVFDSSKVSDHHAIIPTKTMAGSDITDLSSGEKAVLQLISVRLLCAAAEDHRYAEMTVKLSSGAEEFLMSAELRNNAFSHLAGGAVSAFHRNASPHEVRSLRAWDIPTSPCRWKTIHRDTARPKLCP